MLKEGTGVLITESQGADVVGVFFGSFLRLTRDGILMRRDEGAVPAAGLDGADEFKYAIRPGHGIGCHSEISGEFADGGQARFRLELTLADECEDLTPDLFVRVERLNWIDAQHG